MNKNQKEILVMKFFGKEENMMRDKKDKKALLSPYFYHM